MCRGDGDRLVLRHRGHDIAEQFEDLRRQDEVFTVGTGQHFNDVEGASAAVRSVSRLSRDSPGDDSVSGAFGGVSVACWVDNPDVAPPGATNRSTQRQPAQHLGPRHSSGWVASMKANSSTVSGPRTASKPLDWVPSFQAV